MNSSNLFPMYPIESDLVNNGELRLNAFSYSRESILSNKIIESLSKSEIKINKLSDFAKDIFVGARSKRLFTTKNEGIPYLMPTDMFLFNLKPRKWIKFETKDIENWAVSPYTLLITQSGTPGRLLISNKLFENKVLSPNVIRYAPNIQGCHQIGFIYAYLSSWIGQSLLIKDNYGVTVKHIDPQHIGNIPIPNIPELENDINQKILKAYKLKEESQLSLLKAEKLLYKELNLPLIDEEVVDYYNGFEGKLIKASEINFSELNLRFDASYHLPIIRLIEKNLSELNLEIQELNDNITKIHIPPRFKRPYVKNQENGVRYVLPSELPLIKPFESKYLLKEFKNYDKYLLNENEILIVTDGTIGWVSLVTSIIDGLYGSNNFAHILVSDNIDKGFLLAYLISFYGQIQLKREIFGGVIDHLTEEHVRKIKIPLPKMEIQKKIGNHILQAYTKRDLANNIEEEAIKDLENKLLELSKMDRI